MKAVLKVLLGLTLGLVIAEFAFRMRDDGAFPHLNFYVADEALGARLQPNASMKLRVGENNPLTTVTTNSRGYRGAEWAAPSPNDVLVVGDSQTFGLGVNDDETFSAKLAKELNAPVLNLGVPTWGPLEYSAALEEQLKDRKPRACVYVLNLANDLFEADRPNSKRHKIWDGWAVRAETAPASVTNFPGRSWFMSQSHLVFGVRKLMHKKDVLDEGFRSEGSFTDVVAASETMRAEAADEPTKKFLAARKELDDQLRAVSSKLEEHFEQKIYDDDEWATKLSERAGENPNDIFDEDGEAGRSVNSTALHLVTAAMSDSNNDAWLKKLADEKGDPELKRIIDERKELRAKMLALRIESQALNEVPLDRVLARTKKACEAAGARLLVVTLPLDVMVSPDEWKKYGTKPIDLTPTVALRQSLTRRIEALGAEAVDPTFALAAVEPGAFLDKDLHMTPKGHEQVAGVIANILRSPPKAPVLQLPAGRSWLPTQAECEAAPECTVKGSSKAKCSTKLIREWLFVDCELSPDGPHLKLVNVTSGGHGDAYSASNGRFYVPILEGDSVRATFSWFMEERELQLDFPKGGKLAMSFTDAKKASPPASSNVATPAAFPETDVSCPAGELVSGATRRCAKPCSADHRCAEGQHCEPWPTGEFCATP
ncbi:MAG: hypothetical protein QM817_31215 [Archangium sp.]